MTPQIFPFYSLSPSQQVEAARHHISRPEHKYALIKIENHDEPVTIYDVAYNISEVMDAQDGEPDFYQAVVIPDHFVREVYGTVERPVTFETVDSAMRHWTRRHVQANTLEYTSDLPMFWGSSQITAVRVSPIADRVALLSDDGIRGVVFSGSIADCGRFWNQLTSTPIMGRGGE